MRVPPEALFGSGLPALHQMLAARLRIIRLRPVVDDPGNQPVIGKLEPRTGILVLSADAGIDPRRRMTAIGDDATYLKMPVPGYSLLNCMKADLPRIRSRVCGISYTMSSVSRSLSRCQSRCSALST